jgi:hypothetical protein
MRGSIPPISPYVFMAWCLVKNRDNFTFYTLVCGSRRTVARMHVEYGGQGMYVEFIGRTS